MCFRSNMSAMISTVRWGTFDEKLFIPKLIVIFVCFMAIANIL